MNANLDHDSATAFLSPDVVARARKIASAGDYRSPNREDDARDIEQDAWVLVLTAIGRGYQVTDPLAFVSTVTRNAKVNLIRKNAGRRRYEANALDDPKGPAWRLSDGQHSAERQLVASEDAAEVRAQMDRLRMHHPRYARIVAAVVMNGDRVAEVAQAENIRPEAVSTLKHRGLKLLTKMLANSRASARAAPASSAVSSSSATKPVLRRPQSVTVVRHDAIAIGIAA